MTIPPERKKSPAGATGLAIPAGLFIGMGVGFLIDNVTAGLFLGLGGGFLGLLIARAILGEW